MKVLVTGREGQLARSLAEIGRGRLDMTFVARPEFDLLDPAGMERVIDRLRPDVIVNAAAYTAVDAAEDDAETAMAANGVAPGVIARAARKIGARLIQLSTDYVFDGTLERSYCEDDPPSPLGVYGRSKLAGEQAVLHAGIGGAILRTSWVYSPFGQNFLKTMLRLAETRDEVAVVSDQIGCPTSAHSLAEAIVRLLIALRGDERNSEMTVFHAAGTGVTNWAGFAREIFVNRARLIGNRTIVRDLTTADYPTKARRPRNSAMSSDKLSAFLKWRQPAWQADVADTTRFLLTDL